MPPVVHAIAAASEHEARAHLAALLPELLPVGRGEKILLKPSLGSPLPAAAGATTALFLLDVVARHLLELGAEQVLHIEHDEISQHKARADVVIAPPPEETELRLQE